MIHTQTSSFISNFAYELNMLSDAICHLSRNLIVVAVNSPVITKAILARVRECRQTFKVFDVTHLHKQYGSTGSYLRSMLADVSVEFPSVSIFDYTDIIKKLSAHSLAEEININRDLFTKVSNSTIFILSQDLVDAVQSTAPDFWSCVEIFIDGVSWLQNPREVPIWYLDRTGYGLPLRDILNTVDKDIFFTTKYIENRAQILKMYKFSENLVAEFEERLLEIKKYNYLQYIDLSLLWLQTVIDSTVDKSCYNQKTEYISKYSVDISVPQYKARSYQLLGEYWYRCGNFLEARKCFQKAVLLLNEYASDTSTICILQYNVLICKLLLHELSYTEFEESVHSIVSEPCSIRSNFDTFKFLVLLSSRYVSYSERKETLQVLNEVFTKRPEVQKSIVFCEDFVAWEKLLLGSVNKHYSETPIEKNRSDVLRLAYRLVYSFCIGETEGLRNQYKQLRSIALKYEEHNTLKTMNTVFSNMKYILSIVSSFEAL